MSDVEKILRTHAFQSAEFNQSVEETLQVVQEKERRILKGLFVLAFFAGVLDYLLSSDELEDSDNDSPINFKDIKRETPRSSDAFSSSANTVVEQKLLNAGDMRSIVRDADKWSKAISSEESSAMKLLGDMPPNATDEEVIQSLIDSSKATSHFESIARIAITSGIEMILRQPVYKMSYPYRRIQPLHDGVTRDLHLGLEDLGIDRTSLFHEDDPDWARIIPPMYFNCRCGWEPVSVLVAANDGAEEAITWVSRAREVLNAGEISEQEALVKTAPDVFGIARIPESQLPDVWENRF